MTTPGTSCYRKPSKSCILLPLKLCKPFIVNYISLDYPKCQKLQIIINHDLFTTLGTSRHRKFQDGTSVGLTQADRCEAELAYLQPATCEHLWGSLSSISNLMALEHVKLQRHVFKLKYIHAPGTLRKHAGELVYDLKLKDP